MLLPVWVQAVLTPTNATSPSKPLPPPPSSQSRAQEAAMPPPPPAVDLTDDLVGEILLRLPPDDPALLLRASLVCKPWRRILLTDPSFLGRYRAFHGTPPLLGFVKNTNDGVARFVPSAPFLPRNHGRRNCRVSDCRHGRALLHEHTATKNFDFLVWDPITDEEQRVLVHVDISSCHFKGAVLCAAAGCDHRDCHGGPFLIFLVVADELKWATCAFVYSSESGEWSARTNSQMNHYVNMLVVSPLLAGDALYFVCEFGREILRYDLVHGLSTVNGPSCYYYDGVVLMSTVDGLRLAGLTAHRLGLWSLESISAGGTAEWRQLASIQLDKLLQINPSGGLPLLNGCDKVRDSDVVFVSTGDGIFTIELESQKIRKVCERDSTYRVRFFPYMSFLTPDRCVRT